LCDPQRAIVQQNLGMAYNALGEYEHAQRCFEFAVDLKGGFAEKEDLLNIAMAHRNMGEISTALPMLEEALHKFLLEAPHCPVTQAKVRDSLAECYLDANKPEQAVSEYRANAMLLAEHVGKRSPLYGSAMDGLSRALESISKPGDAFDALVEAFEANANMDDIHPTPLYDLLNRAETLSVPKNPSSDNDAHTAMSNTIQPEPRINIRRLVPAINTAVVNLRSHSLDDNSDGGIVLQKMGQVLLACADAEFTDGNRESATRIWRSAGNILRRAKILLENAVRSGEEDLAELSTISAMQLGLADARLAPST